jgi:hypothetical protein
MKILVTLLLIAACLTASGVAISAQQPEGNNNAIFTQKCAFLMGKDLSKPQVTESGKEVTAANLENEKIEQIIIAIDTSGSMRKIVPGIISHLESDLPNPEVPIMVTTFNEQVEKLSDFTTSKNDLKSAFKKVHSTGNSTIVYNTIPQLEQFAGNHCTHIILITDGNETISNKVNIHEMLEKNSHVAISYICWAFGNTGIDTGERVQELDKKSKDDKKEDKDIAQLKKERKGKHIIELSPNPTLKSISFLSGGDVRYMKNWKEFSDYFTERLGNKSILYHLDWRTDNPERPYQVVDPDNGQVITKSFN